MTPRNLAGYRSRLMLDRSRIETVANTIGTVASDLRAEREVRADAIANRLDDAARALGDASGIVDFALDRLPLKGDNPK